MIVSIYQHEKYSNMIILEMIRRSLYTSHVALKNYKMGQHRTKDLQSNFAKITRVSPAYSEKYTKMQKTKSGLWKRQRVDEIHQATMEPVWKDRTKYKRTNQWINQQQTKIAPDMLRKRPVGQKGIPVGGRDLFNDSSKQFDFKEESLVTDYITSYYNSNPIPGVNILKIIKRNHRMLDVDFTIVDKDSSLVKSCWINEKRRADLAKKKLNESAKNLKPQLKGLILVLVTSGFIDLFRTYRRKVLDE